MPRRRQPQQPNALVAAARRVPLHDRKAAAAAGAKAQQWHAEAWGYFDEVPEIKESIRYRGNQLAKVRLFVAVANPNDPDGDPVPASAPDSGVPASVAEAAEAELGRLRSRMGGQAEILRILDMNLEIAGECYLVGWGAYDEEVRQADGTMRMVTQPEDWQVRSTSEVAEENGKYRVKGDPGDTKGRQLDPKRDTIFRVWTKHPQWADLPDSAMRGLLGECRALQVLSQQALAHANRALSAGFLTVPNELSFGPAVPTTPAEEGAEPVDPPDPLDEALHGVLVAPVEDPSSQATVQPGVLRGPAEYLKADYLRRITFYDADLVAGIEQRIEARIARIARGLNLPVEKIMGHQQTTYANAAQVDEDEYADYLAPSVETVADALTYAFLWPQNTENPAVPDEWVEQLFVAADPSGLISEPDTEANANDGWDRGLLSDDSWRKHKGYGGDDAPEPADVLTRTGLRRGIFTADVTVQLLQGIARQAGITLEMPEPAPADGGAPPDPEAMARMLHQLAADPEAVAQLAAALGYTERTSAQGRNLPTLGQGPEPPPFAGRVVAAAPTPGDNAYGRRLTDLDRDLRARLLVATNEAMGRALERAANRLRSRTNGTELANRARQAAHPFAHLGPRLVADVMGDGDPLAGAWDDLGVVFVTWGADTQVQALDVLAAAAGGLAPSVRADLAERQADDLRDAWVWMAEALTQLANQRLYDPSPDAPEQGEHDPTMRVPAGLVRQAIARAGGAVGLLTAAATQPGPAWVTLTDGGTRPAGGIGTGEVIRGGLRDAGVATEAYQWLYGPAYRARPFEPHAQLDGVVFTNFDDPVLANREGWPPTAFYLPGDHAGCICDFVPIVVPAEAAPADAEPDPGGFPEGMGSAREVTEWMRERHGVDAAGMRRAISFEKMPTEVANGLASAMHDMMTRYPGTASRLRLFGDSGYVTQQVKASGRRVGNIGGALADAQPDRAVAWIRFSRTWAKDPARYRQAVDDQVAIGFFPVGTGGTGYLRATVTHEFGHHIRFRADEVAGKVRVRDALNQVLEDHVQATRGVGDTGPGYAKLRRQVIEEDLSRYATTNSDELVAEAVSEVNTSPNPRPLARAIHDAMVALAEG